MGQLVNGALLWEASSSIYSTDTFIQQEFVLFEELSLILHGQCRIAHPSFILPRVCAALCPRLRISKEVALGLSQWLRRKLMVFRIFRSWIQSCRRGQLFRILVHKASWEGAAIAET